MWILMGPKGPRSLLVFSVRGLLPEALKNRRYTMPRNSIDYSIIYRVLQTQLDATITIMHSEKRKKYELPVRPHSFMPTSFL